MWQKHLNWYIEKFSNLNGQFGYRKGKREADSLTVLVNDIHISNSKNNHRILAAADIEKAYEMI